MKRRKITYAARSDMGRVRRNNEDNLYCFGCHLSSEQMLLPFKHGGETKMTKVPAFFAVFDGLGAYRTGEKASLEAAETLDRMLREETAKRNSSLVDENSVSHFVEHYLDVIHRNIESLSEEPAGTTFAAVALFDDCMTVYNIGDSRIYLLNDRGFSRLSIDHTLAGQKIDKGEYDEAYARHTDDWNKLTACIGIPTAEGGRSDCHISAALPLSEGDKILLCSDGVTDMLDDAQLEAVLRSAPAEQAAQELMSKALNNGGIDNTTLIVIEISHR